MPFEILNVFANIILSPTISRGQRCQRQQQDHREKTFYNNLSPLKITTIDFQLQR